VRDEVADHLLDALVRGRRLLEQQLPVAAHHPGAQRRTPELLDGVFGLAAAEGVRAGHLAARAVRHRPAGVRPGVCRHEVGRGAAGAGDQHLAPVARRGALAVQVEPVADLDQVVADVDDRLLHRGAQGERDPGRHQPAVERPPPYGVVVFLQVGRRVSGGARAVRRRVRPQDPLPQPARPAVHDQDEITRGEAGPR
jgi:hypothetical protein